jgi:hypothetical protein
MDDFRPQRRRPADPLEQGLDRLMSAGRQLVDGVSGARPGSRPAGRGSAPLPRIGDLGRWVESRLDGLLDEDDDAWRESWQQQPPAPQPQAGGRRPLEAISRRGQRSSPAGRGDGRPDAGADAVIRSAQEDWPDDASFTLPRWQRDPLAGRPADPVREPAPDSARPLPPVRPLPRSSRRR